jgi:hypothetical protein
VTPATNWVEQSYDCNDQDPNAPFLTPDQEFVDGPGTPVLGAGSLVMHTSQFSGDTQLFRTAEFEGTYASDIKHLVYSTWASPKSGTATKQPAYLRLAFDTDDDGSTDSYLYYEPSINHTVVDGQWQTWEPSDPSELWTTDGSGDAGTLTTLQDWATAHPDARIWQTSGGSAGGVTFIAGCSGSQQTSGNFGVDNFAIQTTANATGNTEVTPPAKAFLYDFDPSDTGVNTVGLTVTDADPHGWNSAAYLASDNNVDAPSGQSNVYGPGTPPLGYGSHKFREDATDTIELWRSPELDGIHVGDIRQLDYSAYIQPDSGNGVPQSPPYLRLSLDVPPSTATGGVAYDNLPIFYYPTANSDDVSPDTWHTYNTVADDKFWSVGGDESAASLSTLAGIAAAFPGATVTTPSGAAGNGGLSLVVGGADTETRNADFFVDAVHTRFFHGTPTEEDVTFDFEPTIPTPTISAPSRVVGTHTVTIHGTAVPNTAVDLYEKGFGDSAFSKVATTTADAGGNYSFHRTISKRTAWYVKNDGKRSARVATSVAIKVHLTLTSPHKGRLHMHITTDPVAAHQFVRYIRLFKNGDHKVIATDYTGPKGKSSETIDADSGKHYRVIAKVAAPSGNKPGTSPSRSIVIR